MRKNNNIILIVIPTPLAFKQFLLDSSLFLKKNGFDIHVACTKYQGDEYYHKDITYHFIDIDRQLNPLKTYKAAAQLNKLIKTLEPYIIHAHFSASAFLLSLCKKRSASFCIATIHGAISTSNGAGWKKWFYFPFEVFALRRMDKSFVLTDDDYVKLKPYVPNLELQYSNGLGVELRKFQPVSDEKKNDVKKVLGISQDHFTIIYVGRLVAFKGFGIVLETFSQIRKEFPSTTLIVCGTTDKIRGMNLTTHQKSIWEEGENILKVGFTSELPKYLGAADINLFPSTREGKPVNLMESISMGIPCVTSNFRGCRHIVLHNINGIIVRNHHSEYYKDAIEKLIRDEEKLHRLRVGCINTRFLYDRNLFSRELLELYNQKLKR